MAYTSIKFYIFLVAVLLIYYMIPFSFRWLSLLAASVAFYFMVYRTGWWILLIQILLTYAAGMCIGSLNRKNTVFYYRLKETILVVILLFTAIPWFCIKNGDFILSSVLYRPTFSWIVPLGISFYTFQMISYLVDIYKDKIQAQANPLKYALFILFFPQIVQGPIPRYGDLAEQLYQGHLFEEKTFCRGFQMILWGFFLKFMIADKSAVVVNEIFAYPSQYTGCYVLVAGVLYSFELYADFMACTKICRGTAELFGIHLSDNFMRPYQSVSVKDFWRRWHISLSSWLRDYIYIPLGGSRKGKVLKYINLTITFAVSGIWHGGGYKFLFWGLLHVFYQIVGDLTAEVQNKMFRFLKLREQTAAYKMFQRISVFFWVMLAWVIFRADSLTIGIGMVKSIFTVYNPWIFFNDSLFLLGLEWKEWYVLLISVGILLFIEHRQENGTHISEHILILPFYMRWFLYITVILVVMIYGTYGFGFDAQDFIYRDF